MMYFGNEYRAIYEDGAWLIYSLIDGVSAVLTDKQMMYLMAKSDRPLMIFQGSISV